MARNKPRPKSRVEKVGKVKAVDVSNPKNLPLHYLGVSEGWEKTIGRWEEKLNKRGLKVKRPLTLYRLKRVTGAELCLELEEI